MALSVGIVGMPNVGKSTLLNALTQSNAEASNYPFCTIDKNVGIAEVPDENLYHLKKILNPEETVPTTVQFIDIAGLVEGASKGEGLGNKFLGHIREVDAILHVVRCFCDENVSHVYSKPDPLRDVGVVEMELIRSDFSIAESLTDKITRVVRGGDKDKQIELNVITRCLDSLKSGNPLRHLTLTEDDIRILRNYNFLSYKSILYLANVDESDPSGEGSLAKALRDAIGDDKVIPLAVKIEDEITELQASEREAFLKDMGIAKPGINRVIKSCYSLLNLITFYTIANNKLRAWQLQHGCSALQAAGRVHTDMARGFIRSEVMTLDDLLRLGKRSTLQEQGLVHIVGKDYIVKDNDVLQFHFKV